MSFVCTARKHSPNNVEREFPVCNMFSTRLLHISTMETVQNNVLRFTLQRYIKTLNNVLNLHNPLTIPLQIENKSLKDCTTMTQILCCEMRVKTDNTYINYHD